jgi:hypothetical protein
MTWFKSIWDRIRREEEQEAAPAVAPAPAPASRHISPIGLALVRHFESFFPKAYKDPIGIWTIGYGHTGLTHLDGTVKAGASSRWRRARSCLLTTCASLSATS